MILSRKLLAVLCFSMLALHLAAQTAKEPVRFPIIPVPQKLVPLQGTFTITPTTRLGIDIQQESLQWVADYLNSAVSQTLGTPLSIPDNLKKVKNGIVFRLNPEMGTREGYFLQIHPDGILVQASSEAGLFYAVQSLIQLFPSQPSGNIALPCVEIEDFPAFPYRGMHLDVGRHFFPVPFIKKYIDMLARYKMNRFHWHLTEDQGWRIEIKKYPRLQEVAAWRKETLVGHYSDQPRKFDGMRYGGYYTQDEVREVVRYAQERFVTIIPEIEMPGHAQAAIAAYPELGCTGKPLEVATTWGVFDDVFCPNEQTFRFLEDVLTEVMDLFPSEYIHIGGDECPKTQWKTSAVAQELIKKEGLKDEHELQSYFIRRMERFLNAKGRQIIGWDEILEGGLAPNATVMSWRGIEGGIDAARQHHKVIMTPTSYCYLDYYQSTHPDEPLAIGGYLPLEKVYSFNPVPEALNAEEATYIQGVQGNLWTEYIPNGKKVEYMVYPRMHAIAETGWSGQEKKNFPDFVKRLLIHLERLRAQGVNAANHFYDIVPEVIAGDGQGVRIDFRNLAESGTVHYNTDNMMPHFKDPVFKGPMPVDKNGTYTARTFEGEEPLGHAGQLSLEMHLAAGKKIDLLTQPAPQYSGAGPGSLINAVRGNSERYGDKEWLGFEGKDLEAVIDLGEPTSFRKIGFRFFNSPGQWIYPPKEIEISAGNLPGQYEATKSIKLSPVGENAGLTISSALIFNTRARFLKIRISNYGVIPEGSAGAGHRAWLFVDEIFVQ